MRRSLLALVLGGCAGRTDVDWTAQQEPEKVEREADAVARMRAEAAVDDEAELRRGIGLVERGDLVEGEKALRSALAAPRGSWVFGEAKRWLGHVRTRSGDPVGALEWYAAAREELPLDPGLQYASGIAWGELGERQRAEECFTRALDLDERHIESLQWRGQLRMDRGAHGGALEDLTRALACIESATAEELAPADATRDELLLRTLLLRSEAFDALGDHAAAERDRERRAELLEPR